MSEALIDRINALFVETDSDVEDAFHGGDVMDKPYTWDEDSVIEFKKQLNEAKINFKLEDRYGGEDQGNDYWSVYSFTDGMQVVFIKFDGYYASYDGSTFEEFYEVKAVEYTSTMFVKK
jgi:ABC-type glycerol-3-phosphate transport system substrate-binding protein